MSRITPTEEPVPKPPPPETTEEAAEDRAARYLNSPDGKALIDETVSRYGSSTTPEMTAHEVRQVAGLILWTHLVKSYRKPIPDETANSFHARARIHVRKAVVTTLTAQRKPIPRNTRSVPTNREKLTAGNVAEYLQAQVTTPRKANAQRVQGVRRTQGQETRLHSPTVPKVMHTQSRDFTHVQQTNNGQAQEPYTGEPIEGSPADGQVDARQPESAAHSPPCPDPVDGQPTPPLREGNHPVPPTVMVALCEVAVPEEAEALLRWLARGQARDLAVYWGPSRMTSTVRVFATRVAQSLKAWDGEAVPQEADLPRAAWPLYRYLQVQGDDLSR